MDDAASEAVLVQELELDGDVLRQRPLPTTDNDRAEEQVELVDEARGDCLGGKLRTADRDVVGRRLLELSDGSGVEGSLDPRPARSKAPEASASTRPWRPTATSPQSLG